MPLLASEGGAVRTRARLPHEWDAPCKLARNSLEPPNTSRISPPLALVSKAVFEGCFCVSKGCLELPSSDELCPGR
jgi:hypothetical protein